MFQHKRNTSSRNRKRHTQANLNLEALEPRQMLTADLSGGLPLDLLNRGVPPKVQFAPLLNSVSQDGASGSVIPGKPIQQGGLVIPATSASPRTLDGTGNNQSHPQWGSTNEQLLRTAPNDYADGISELAGADRPSAREISNALVAETETAGGNARNMSAYAYVWGQFLDHDLGLTSASTSDSERANIQVPVGDPEFDPAGTGTQTIGFHRSKYDNITKNSVANPRQQVNGLTSFIDGSMIYGVDQATADSLRSFKGGRLLVGKDGLPPVDQNGFFIAGDERANENVELTSMHTLFIREHNFWAGKIAARNSILSDQAIFQQARSIVIGEIQAITYNEFLPSLLGAGAISRYSGYRATVNPGIANEFSTAAYRLHTLINDDVEFFGNDGRSVAEEVALKDAFFNPDLLRETGIDSILKYVASTQSREFDTQLVDSLRNFLFGQPGQGGFDLAALNIQRGRDHGLADFNTTREAYGLGRVTSFADITSDPTSQRALAGLYESVDDIDLWVGLLAEDHSTGSSAGETAQAIMVDQFERTRDGDRFWYQNIFVGRSLQQIHATKLSDIISRNTSISNLQKNVFTFRSEVNGQVFVDKDANGRIGRGEHGLAGVKIELLNDVNEVIATTKTNRHGRYSFDDFKETGDYQVRIVVNKQMSLTTAGTQNFLISRGDLRVSNRNFGVRSSQLTKVNPGLNQSNDAMLQVNTDLAFSGIDFGNNPKSKAKRPG